MITKAPLHPCDACSPLDFSLHLLGCGRHASGQGYNSGGNFCGRWAGNCGEGGSGGFSWYLICDRCRARYLKEKGGAGLASSAKAPATALESGGGEKGKGKASGKKGVKSNSSSKLFGGEKCRTSYRSSRQPAFASESPRDPHSIPATATPTRETADDKSYVAVIDAKLHIGVFVKIHEVYQTMKLHETYMKLQ